MARAPIASEDPTWMDEHLVVTPEAQDRVCASHIWYHLGGWSEDGDTYDTQEHEFEQALDRYWAELIGPDENLRRAIAFAADGIQPEWERVTIRSDGAVIIHFKDGQTKGIQPPIATIPAR